MLPLRYLRGGFHPLSVKLFAKRCEQNLVRLLVDVAIQFAGLWSLLLQDRAECFLASFHCLQVSVRAPRGLPVPLLAHMQRTSQTLTQSSAFRLTQTLVEANPDVTASKREAASLRLQISSALKMVQSSLGKDDSTTAALQQALDTVKALEVDLKARAAMDCITET